MEPPTLAPAAGPTLASLDLPAARWGGVLQAPKGPEEQAAAPDDDDLAAPPPTPREARALLRDTLARAKSEPAEDESIRALIQLVDGLPAAIDSYTRATLHAAMPRLHPSWLPCVRLLTLEGGLDRLLGRRGAALDRSSLTCWLQALPAPDPLLSHRLAAPVHKVLAYGGGSAWNQDYTSFTLLARPTLAGTLLEYREALQGHLALLNRLTGLLAPGGSLRELLEALLEPPYWGVERLLPDSDGERSLVAFERRVERHVNKGRAPSSVGTGGSGQVLDGVAHAIHAMWKAERGLWRSGWATALRETALLRHHLNSEQVAQDDHRSIARHLLGCLQQGPGELAALLNLPEGRPDPLGPRVRRCRLEEQIEETLRESLGADGRRDRVLPGRRLCFEPQDKLRALRERPTDEDEHTVSDTLRILSPHLVRYAIHDDEGRLSGSLCLVEAWASPEDPAEANPHARLPVLCLEQLRSTDLHLYALRLDLLHALQRLAEARGLVGLVLVSDSSAWCHPSELELDALHANRRGIPVTLEPADPASWRCLERAAGGRPLHPSCVFRSCARGGGSGVLLAPLDAPGHALHPENLTELDRLAQQMGPGLTITAGSREHPQGFISGLPRPPRS